MPKPKRDVARRLDTLIERSVRFRPARKSRSTKLGSTLG